MLNAAKMLHSLRAMMWVFLGFVHVFFGPVDYSQSINELAFMVIFPGFRSGLGFWAPGFGYILNLQPTYAKDLKSFVLTTPERTAVCYFCLLDEKLSYRKRERQIPKMICVFQSSLISVGVYVLNVHQSFGMSQGISVFTNFIFQEWDLDLKFPVQKGEREREALLN